MKTAQLFSETMALLWDDHPNADKVARAIAAHIKTHRVNSENALEVLNIMWPDATMTIHPDGQGTEPGSLWFDITFKDGSQCMVNANRGIGDGMEVL